VVIAGSGSTISSRTSGTGRGGDITVRARGIRLHDGAAILATSTGSNKAGNILLRAREALLSEQSLISTEALHADGGNITVQVQHMLRLRDSTITASVGLGRQSVGGNVTIDPEFVILENSLIAANAIAGQGGSVQVTAGVFLADPASSVSAFSILNIDGQVDIQAPVTNLSGLVAPLAANFAAAATLLRDRCPARLREGAVSTLVERQRDGVPATPAGALPNRLFSVHPLRSSRQLPPRLGLKRGPDHRLHIHDWVTPVARTPLWTQDCAAR
jgi:hypothetical protein